MPRKVEEMGLDINDLGSVLCFLREKINEINHKQPEGIVYIGKFNPIVVKKAFEIIQVRNKFSLDSEGNLYIYGYTSKAHDAICGSLLLSLASSLKEMEVDRSLYTAMTGGMCYIGEEMKVPDVSIMDKGFIGKASDSHGNNYPTFVAEIAVSNESAPRLYQEIDRWLSEETSVISGLGIKIFGVLSNGTRRMLIFFKCRDGNYQEMEFGDNIDNPPNEFQVDSKYIVPSILPISGKVKFDLNEIRENVQNLMNYE